MQGAVSRLPRPDVSDAFRARIAAIGMAARAGADEATEPQRGAPSALPGLIAAPAAARGETPERALPDAAGQGAPLRLVRLARHGGVDHDQRGAGQRGDAMGDAERRVGRLCRRGRQRPSPQPACGEPVDIVSSDRHTVKPWLDARIGVSPPAPDLAKDGFALIGGRVEVYRRPAGAGAGLPPPRASDHAGRRSRRKAARHPTPDDLSAGGFSMVHWSDGAFSYWAISDMERPELDDFVARFRKAAV